MTLEEIDKRLKDLRLKACNAMSHWKALQGEIQTYERERERLENEAQKGRRKEEV